MLSPYKILMKKKKDHPQKVITLKLPTETVIVGPGTVPTSGASLSTTSIEEMSISLRKASKVGLFDSFMKDEPSTSTGK